MYTYYLGSFSDGAKLYEIDRKKAVELNGNDNIQMMEEYAFCDVSYNNNGMGEYENNGLIVEYLEV